MTRLHDSPRAQRRGRRRFYDDGVAANQRRRHLPAWNCARKIPWSHQTDDPDGFADGEHVYTLTLGWNQESGQARSLAAEVAEDVDGPADFALRFRKCLAFL